MKTKKPPLSVYLRGSTYWGSFTINGTKTQVSLKTTDKRTAQRTLAALKDKALAEALLGVPNEPKSTSEAPKMTLAQARDRMYSEVWSSNRTGLKSKRNFECVMYNAFTPDTLIADITSAKMVTARQVLTTDTRGPSTVNRLFAAFKTVLNRAHKVWEVIDKVPRIEMSREPEGRQRFFSAEEERDLLRHLNDHDVHAALLCAVMIDTGLRVSEALGIGLGTSVDLDARTVTVSARTAKSKKSRTIPMTQRVFAILSQDPELGLRLYESKLRGAWKGARDAMGLGDDLEFVPHALRHTFCSRLVQRNVNLAVVQKLAGHADISTTMRYVHLQDEDLRMAIKELEL